MRNTEQLSTFSANEDRKGEDAWGELQCTLTLQLNSGWDKASSNRKRPGPLGSSFTWWSVAVSAQLHELGTDFLHLIFCFLEGVSVPAVISNNVPELAHDSLLFSCPKLIGILFDSLQYPARKFLSTLCPRLMQLSLVSCPGARWTQSGWAAVLWGGLEGLVDDQQRVEQPTRALESDRRGIGSRLYHLLVVWTL